MDTYEPLQGGTLRRMMPLPPLPSLTNSSSSFSPFNDTSSSSTTSTSSPPPRRVPPPPPPRRPVLSATATATLSEDQLSAKRTTKRATAARELYETEVTYVRSIMILTNGFMVPCKSEGILDKHQVSQVFSNVSQLLTFHKDFLKQLKERVDAWTDESAIGDIVLSVTPYMKLYTAYSANYDKATTAVQVFSKKYPRFAEFLDRCMQSASFGGLTLNAYLIMPIQRIPRYRMLLEVLVGATPESHPDYAQLVEALGVVRDVATYINTHIAKEDNTRNLIRIQNLVPKQQILSPTRKFILEASYPTNYFVLFKRNTKEEKKKSNSSPSISHLNRIRSDHGGDEELEDKEMKEMKDMKEKETTTVSTPRRTSYLLSTPSLKALSGSDGGRGQFGQAVLYLFDDLLVLQSVKDRNRSASFHLSTTWIRTQPEYGCVIELVTLEMTFVVVTGTEEEQMEWIEALTLAINNLITLNEDDRNLRDQFVIRRCHGEWRPIPASLLSLSSSSWEAVDEMGDGEDEIGEDGESGGGGGNKTPRKKTPFGVGKGGGLLIVSSGANSPILSPRARTAYLTRNVSTSTILAQMKETMIAAGHIIPFS